MYTFVNFTFCKYIFLYLSVRADSILIWCPLLVGLTWPIPTDSNEAHLPTPRYGQYLRHAHNHITRAVAVMDSCFALVGAHQHGVAVGAMSRVNPRIRDPLLPRRYCRVLPWCLLHIVPPGRQRDRKKSEKKSVCKPLLLSLTSTIVFRV